MEQERASAQSMKTQSSGLLEQMAFFKLAGDQDAAVETEEIDEKVAT